MICLCSPLLSLQRKERRNNIVGIGWSVDVPLYWVYREKREETTLLVLDDLSMFPSTESTEKREKKHRWYWMICLCSPLLSLQRKERRNNIVGIGWSVYVPLYIEKREETLLVVDDLPMFPSIESTEKRKRRNNIVGIGWSIDVPLYWVYREKRISISNVLCRAS